MSDIMGFGLDITGRRLFPSVDEKAFTQELVDALERNGQRIQFHTGVTTKGLSFKSEVERQILDIGDPKSAGWTFLVNEKDPLREGLESAITPLAVHRKMDDPQQPLVFHGEPSEEWQNWIDENYLALQLNGKNVPQYILILGGPDQVPFGFQSILNTLAKVGRVCFDPPDALDKLKRYVDKLIRLETALEPAVTREILVFAPDGDPQDPTYYSEKYMVEPLADYIRTTLKFPVLDLLDYHATKANLKSMLETHRPALVYTASHGLGAMNEPEAFQRAYNGAICCQHVGELTLDDLYSAQDVPPDSQPFLEGAVFFQFACFGYGTPAESEYAQWVKEVPAHYTRADFVAALPQRLLAHPQGPIGYIGHLDTAFLQGFANINNPNLTRQWDVRMSPFVSAVDNLLKVQPSGLSLHNMSAIYSLCNAKITNFYGRQRRDPSALTPENQADFLDTWIRRGDAQNYMVFGDPGARLYI